MRIEIGLLMTLILTSMLPLAGLFEATGSFRDFMESEVGDSVVLDFSFHCPVVSKGSSGYESVEMSDLPKYGSPGEPILPVKTVRVLIPQGKDVENVSVTSGSRIVLEGRFDVDYGKTPMPIGSNVSVEDHPNPEIYGSANVFPSFLFSGVSEQNLRGYRILLVTLHPVQFVPLLGELCYFDTLTVNVDLKETGEISEWFRNLPQDRELILSFVDNPDAVNTYVQVKTPVKTGCICDPSFSYDYVIITSDALMGSFQPLIDWKNGKDVKATIVSVEDIMSDPDYNWDGMWGDGTGSIAFDDTAAHIRNFIKDAYANWNTAYVLLGQDDEIIPARSVFSSAPNGVPCDMYYGALDGSWNNDNDAVFGECVSNWPDIGTAGEEADFYAEVFIGRAPVNNAEEATNFVSKTKAYEGNSDADYLQRALMVGEFLSYVSEAGNGKDLVTDIIPQYTTTRLYERDGTFSRATVIEEMNRGVHIINHGGHANWEFVMTLSRSDVDSLTNTHYFMVYSYSCLSGAFDEAESGPGDAIGERFVTSKGGAFAYIGNSRDGQFTPGTTDGDGDVFDRAFFSQLKGGIRNIGQALQRSKQHLYDVLGESVGHLTYFELNLLGDPETEIVTAIRAPTAHLQTNREYLLDPARIGGIINIRGTAKRGTTADAAFQSYEIEYGVGTNPSSWMTQGISLMNNGEGEVIDGTLATWDTRRLSPQLMTVRLTVFDGNGRMGEDRWVVLVSDGWEKERTCSNLLDASHPYTEVSQVVSIATDNLGNLWTAHDYLNNTSGLYEIGLAKSSDGGESWLIVERLHDPTHNLFHPAIAIDPYRNDIFVAFEFELTDMENDIFVYRCVDGVWDMRKIPAPLNLNTHPSITSEYQYGPQSGNCQYISFEHQDDGSAETRLMFAKSTDHGANWVCETLHPESSGYYTQTSITNAQGNIYIAYRWAATVSGPGEIRVSRSTDSGSSWTQFQCVNGPDLVNTCSFPSVAATHGGDAVMIAFQYEKSSVDTDIWFSYSLDNGATWRKGIALFASSPEYETMPAVTVDGMEKTENDVKGYFHAVCRSDHYVYYKKAYYRDFGGSQLEYAWSDRQIVNEKWIVKEKWINHALALTTRFSNGRAQSYPCIAWFYQHDPRVVYYSTPKEWNNPIATIYIMTDGSIDPLTAPIQRNGDVYALTDDIRSYNGGIEIYRNYMTLDGAGHALQGNLLGAGITSWYTTNITITNIRITSYEVGILTKRDTNMTISNNDVTANLQCGIDLWALSNSSILGNCIANNEYGISLLLAYKNRFYHNGFVNNAHQVYDYSWDFPQEFIRSINEWNSSYPSGGNYWSDYTGVDLYKGTYQNEAGGDGIGDTPYNIDELNKDNYPLKGHFSILAMGVSTVSNSTISNFQVTNTEISFDVSGQPGTTGFCTLTILHSISLPPYTITVDGALIPYTTIFQDDTLSIIYITYQHSTHEIVITSSPFIGTTVDIQSQTLNLGSKGQWITIYIELLKGFDVNNINVSSILVNNTISVAPSAPATVGDYDGDGTPELIVEFNRTAVSEFILSEGIMVGNVTLSITGKLYSSTRFEGSVVIRVRMPGDINMDGKVDMKDMAFAAKSFGSYPGHPRWNYIADENEDNKVDIRDLVVIAKNFGKTYQ